MAPSSHESKIPARPTRRVKEKIKQDGFRTLVHHLREPDLFITINYAARPEPYEWVLIGFADDGEPIIDLYNGQLFLGVVELMDLYKLTQSEQWRPQIRNRWSNW